jgi:hypothetical protein
MWDWKPGPVVVAVFITGVLGVWVVLSLRLYYGVSLQGIDVALNLVVFMTLSGWWTDRMGRR